MSEVALLWAIFFMAQAIFLKQRGDRIGSIFSGISYLMSISWITIYFVFDILPEL